MLFPDLSISECRVFLFRLCLSFGAFPGKLLEQHTRRSEAFVVLPNTFFIHGNFSQSGRSPINSSFRVSPVGHLFLVLFSPCKTRKKPCVCAYYLHV